MFLSVCLLPYTRVTGLFAQSDFEQKHRYLMTDNGILPSVGTGYFSLCFRDKALQINVLLMSFLCLHAHFPWTKSHNSSRQSMEEPNMWYKQTNKTMLHKISSLGKTKQNRKLTVKFLVFQIAWELLRNMFSGRSVGICGGRLQRLIELWK